jgi:hypothetical protein
MLLFVLRYLYNGWNLYKWSFHFLWGKTHVGSNFNMEKHLQKSFGKKYFENAIAYGFWELGVQSLES